MNTCCYDAYNIFYANVKYWNSPHLHNNGKPIYIPVGWGETGSLYRWGCVSKKMMKILIKITNFLHWFTSLSVSYTNICSF